MPRADVARAGEPLERLVEAVSGADTVVLLGDVLELREGPVASVLEAARPLFERLGAVTAGKRLVLSAGNHDHQLAEPWLDRARLEGRPLEPAAEFPVDPGDGPAGLLAELMPDTEVVMAYPGTFVRDDVYVTHGHYLDLHMTVPRFETLAGSVVARFLGRRDAPRSVDEHEAIGSPLYALLYGMAQATATQALRKRGNVSRRVWSSLNGGDSSRLTRFALGRVTIPGAVAVLNRLGLGPFDSMLTGVALRQAGLKAMGTVIDGLGVEAGHAVFGHTHRAGPLPGDDPADWCTAGSTQLWNSGTWLHESVLIAGGGSAHPYWPGTVVLVPEEGDPEVVNVLRDADVGALAIDKQT